MAIPASITTVAPLEVRVGEVVQRDGLTEAEDRFGFGEKMVLQGLAVLVQRVRGAVLAVLAVQVHRLEVAVDQLTQSRAPLQPGVRGQLAAGLRHAANDVAHGGGDRCTEQRALTAHQLINALDQRGAIQCEADRSGCPG